MGAVGFAHDVVNGCGFLCFVDGGRWTSVIRYRKRRLRRRNKWDPEEISRSEAGSKNGRRESKGLGSFPDVVQCGAVELLEAPAVLKSRGDLWISKYGFHRRLSDHIGHDRTAATGYHYHTVPFFYPSFSSSSS